MIDFNSETDFQLNNEESLKTWISEIIVSEGYEVGEIIYVFCDDPYLHKLNVEFLDHDNLTDVISFDYKLGKQINGEIYISVDRVADNSKDFKTVFQDELHRVIIHGILHFCGYKDKSDSDETLMRLKEDESLVLLNRLL